MYLVTFNHCKKPQSNGTNPRSGSTLTSAHMFLGSCPPDFMEICSVFWDISVRAIQSDRGHRHNLLGRRKLCFQGIKAWPGVASSSPAPCRSWLQPAGLPCLYATQSVCKHKTLCYAEVAPKVRTWDCSCLWTWANMKQETKANTLKSEFSPWTRIFTHKGEGQRPFLAPLNGLLVFISFLVWGLGLIEGSSLVGGICPGGNLPRWVLRVSLRLLASNHPGNSLCNSRHISKAGSALSLNSCANISLVQHNEITRRWTFTGCNQIRSKAPALVIQLNYSVT